MNTNQINEWFESQNEYYIMWDHCHSSYNYFINLRRDGRHVGRADTYSAAQELAYKAWKKGIHVLNAGDTYVDYLKKNERELAVMLGQPEIRNNKRKADILGLMFTLTQDAIDQEVT